MTPQSKKELIVATESAAVRRYEAARRIADPAKRLAALKRLEADISGSGDIELGDKWKNRGGFFALGSIFGVAIGAFAGLASLAVLPISGAAWLLAIPLAPAIGAVIGAAAGSALGGKLDYYMPLEDQTHKRETRRQYGTLRHAAVMNKLWTAVSRDIQGLEKAQNRAYARAARRSLAPLRHQFDDIAARPLPPPSPRSAPLPPPSFKRKPG